MPTGASVNLLGIESILARTKTNAFVTEGVGYREITSVCYRAAGAVAATDVAAASAKIRW